MKGLSSKMVWTISGFVASSGMRFALNIVLSYLLAPDIMGVMLVVNAVRLGIELLTDVGIEQNIVHHPDGLDRAFRDTAWTMQVLRGFFLSLLFAAATPFLAQTYHIDVRIFWLVACSPLLGGLHSTAIFVLVKQVEVRRRNQFELGSELLGFLVSVGLAYTLRSVWAPAFALVCTVAIRSGLSYLLPDSAQQFRLDPQIRRRILHYGKWIMLTSLVMYAATNLDRLYLGQAVPLGLVGIYGIARAMAELPTNLARRLSYQIIFPVMAHHREDGADVGRVVARTRLLFACAVCLALGVGTGLSDGVISLIYDLRYVSAGWILAVLLVGGAFAVLSNLNEALLLAARRPAFSSFANGARFCTMAICLPAGLHWLGFPGAVLAIALTEICQYGYIAIGLARLGRAPWRDDAMAIGAYVIALGGVCCLRYGLGFNQSFQPIWGML